MRIGIVTQPLKNNYGGLLQNYALQAVLKKLGHQAITINYLPHTSRFRYMLSVCKTIVSLPFASKRRKFVKYSSNVSRLPYSQDFIDNYISVTEVYHKYKKASLSKYNIDAVITGSDQVWRPLYNRYIKSMFLDFVPDEIKKIAYAVSLGVSDWEFSLMQTKICAKLAKRLFLIGVREQSAIKLCEDKLNVNATLVLDPTLLLNADDYMALLDINKDIECQKYLFSYMLDMSPEKIQYVNQLARDKGLKVVIATVGDVSVQEWLKHIMLAELVVTDSFHGTAFSINFNKQFVSLSNSARGSDRFISLLDLFGLRERLVIDANLPFADSTIDWTFVNQVLHDLRICSLKFLKDSLE